MKTFLKYVNVFLFTQKREHLIVMGLHRLFLFKYFMKTRRLKSTNVGPGISWRPLLPGSWPWYTLTASRRLTCIHTKHFPTVKRRTCVHDLRHYSRNSYFVRHASGSRLGDPEQKALQTTIEPTLFVDFCLIPFSNTCSFVWPDRNVNREIFFHCQEGFCVGKFGRVVDQAVLDNRPLRKHFRRSRLSYKRQVLLKI